MSGIIAYTGPQAAAPQLIDGLRRQNPIGHDSAGIAIVARKRLRVWKALGSLSSLAHQLPNDIAGHCGIGHTRLATHGAPSNDNAHPHLDADERIAIVHNGLIENADVLRRQLVAEGIRFRSDTDSEVLAILIARELVTGVALEEALRIVLGKIDGTCGIAVLDRDASDRIVVARIGSPMFVGSADGASYASSDAAALRGRVETIVPLEDGEIATLTPGVTRVAADRPSRMSPESRNAPDADPTNAELDDESSGNRLYREITEQPTAIARVLAGRLDRRFAGARLGGLNLTPEQLRDIRRIHILGCGSAWHAALSGARMIESLARLPARAESAGEFRFRDPIIEKDTLYIVASRSGETFDSLAALREIRQRGGVVLGVVNDVGSTIAREVDGGVYLHVGSERSIVATKTVSAMLTVFALIALLLGRYRDVSPQRGSKLIDAFDALPGQIAEVLALETRIAEIASDLRDANSVLFTGRAAGYAIALEGARKLSESSAKHTLVSPAAELAHGPIVLLDAKTPCIVLLPEADLLPLSLSSLERIKARGAPLIVIGDTDEPRVAELADELLRLPRTEAILQPIVAGIALQLLAYHSGVALGRDVNHPASLADRVTIE